MIMRYNKRTNPREYRIWCAMKSRCYAPSNANMGHYQELGIQVCDRWRHSFQAFMEDMGECPNDCSIDRIDGHGDYEPQNCRWATVAEQARNRSLTRWFTLGGETMCLKDWADKFGIDYNVLHHRMSRYGYSFEEAIDPHFGELKRNNTSGVKGVSYHKGKNVWVAYACIGDGKQSTSDSLKVLTRRSQFASNTRNL